jgi:hypothetical protein
MKPTYLRRPPVPATWKHLASDWEEFWVRIRGELLTHSLAKPEFYLAHNNIEVWVWCRGEHPDGHTEYRYWCFDDTDALAWFTEELYPMERLPSRVWNRDDNVWIDLPKIHTLHVGQMGKGTSKLPERHLTGEKIQTTWIVPVMPGGF